MKRIILPFFLCLCVNSVFGYSFENGGIYYNILDENSVAVTFKSLSGNPYSGNINIPSTVENNGKTYSVTTIGEQAFGNCDSLTSVTIPNSITSIGRRAFTTCKSLTSITIPESVTTLGAYAFMNCEGLTSVVIPNSISEIKIGTFYGCKGLTSVNIPNSVTTIGDGVFHRCTGLTSVSIPNSVTAIKSETFLGCTGLTAISIPESVTSIGKDAFYGCTALTSATIGSSVTSIAYMAFSNCSAMTDVYTYILRPDTITLGNNVFSMSMSTCNLHVVKGCIDLYKAADQWKDFPNIIDDLSTGISNISTTALRVNSSNGKLGIYSDGVLDGITVYDMSGRLVSSHTEKSQRYEVTVSPGTYIVKSGNEGIKIIVK